MAINKFTCTQGACAGYCFIKIATQTTITFSYSATVAIRKFTDAGITQ